MRNFVGGAPTVYACANTTKGGKSYRVDRNSLVFDRFEQGGAPRVRDAFTSGQTSYRRSEVGRLLNSQLAKMVIGGILL